MTAQDDDSKTDIEIYEDAMKVLIEVLGSDNDGNLMVVEIKKKMLQFSWTATTAVEGKESAVGRCLGGSV